MIRYGDLIFPDAYARPQYTPAEELRQELEAEWMEENSWLEDIEPSFDEAYPRSEAA